MKFDLELIPLILSGKKTITYRLFDDKNLQKGDDVLLINSKTSKAFARAKVKSVVEKQLGNLDSEDKTCHEVYQNDKEKYKTFSKYYRRIVGLNTLVKVIKFELSP